MNPDVTPFTRNTGRGVLVKKYMRQKADLKEELASIPNRISLTCDLWTSCNMEGFVCLTAHYVDSKWNLQSKIINFQHMPPPHTDLKENLAYVMHNFKVIKNDGKFRVCDHGYKLCFTGVTEFARH